MLNLEICYIVTLLWTLHIFPTSIAFFFCRDENNEGVEENWDEDTDNSSDQFDPNSK